ncbi:MAG: succinate dehydrogenase/fumarate reductase iron-sulfur subunit [Kofleriaceae bacterium]|nr:succinate dehydrogenase/fumarate reductase iron-sulfur subunit [Kofleriaceae bacterium]MBP9208644.1 succinate dehydrogenase/fumarate reductase iron-sulfur subunit [Kofleriaceae bacterium]
MNLTVHVWRQKDKQSPGKMVAYQVTGISEHASFLEMLDVLNEQLLAKGEEPVAFDHDCREGICGTCSLVINGRPHGGHKATTTCQLHMRSFKSGDSIYVEPWRAAAFPVLRDLCVDRTGFEKIQQAGGFITANVGSAPDANSVPIGKEDADRAMEAAACIGCGACVAACPNGSAMLFLGAKLSHLHNLPQGQPERAHRSKAMVEAMDAAGFGNCSNHYECEAACPKEISRDVIAELNRDFVKSTLVHRGRSTKADGAG